MLGGYSPLSENEEQLYILRQHRDKNFWIASKLISSILMVIKWSGRFDDDDDDDNNNSNPLLTEPIFITQLTKGVVTTP